MTIPPTHSFFYNPHYELTGETLPNATSILYGLDANGNRTSVTTNGVTDYYGVDAANKLLWVNRSSDPHLAPTPGQSSPYTILGYL